MLESLTSFVTLLCQYLFFVFGSVYSSHAVSHPAGWVEFKLVCWALGLGPSARPRPARSGSVYTKTPVTLWRLGMIVSARV